MSRKFRFSVIYIKDGKLKHKQVMSYAAFCAVEEFQEANPDVEVLEAGLGSINKEVWKEVAKEFEKQKEKK